MSNVIQFPKKMVKKSIRDIVGADPQLSAMREELVAEVQKELLKEAQETAEQKLCNKCGEICHTDEFGGEPYGLSTTVDAGYFSTALQDGNSYTFSICESCLVELFTGFKIPVKVDEYEY